MAEEGGTAGLPDLHLSGEYVAEPLTHQRQGLGSDGATWSEHHFGSREAKFGVCKTI